MHRLIDIFNEKKYAEDMMKLGFLSPKFQFELRILAKYFKFVEYMKPAKIKKALISFCEVAFPNFNFDVNYDLINSAMNYLKSAKCKFVEIDSVFISEELVQYFVKLKLDNDSKKILFTLAVWGKINLLLGYNENFAYSNSDYRDLKKIANADFKGGIFNKLHELSNEGYIRGCYTGAIELLFLKNIPQGDGIYKLSDFKNIGAWFDFYNGVNKLYICERCGGIFKKNNSKSANQKFCKSCSEIPASIIKRTECAKCGDTIFTKNKTTKSQFCENCKI